MNLNNILFLDIETVSHEASYDQLDERWNSLWDAKSKYFKNEGIAITPSEAYSQKAAIFAEFGKIVCIGLGIYKQNELRLKTISGDNEKKIIEDFFELVKKHFSNPQTHSFCGHNIREFDIPYICRRALINGVEIPEIFNLGSKKPWEVKYIHDTLEYWRYGDYKHYVSLDLLAACLGLPSSKNNMHGSQVTEEYWRKQNIDGISKYCLEDVALTFKVFCRLIQFSSMEEISLKYID